MSYITLYGYKYLCMSLIAGQTAGPIAIQFTEL